MNSTDDLRFAQVISRLDERFGTPGRTVSRQKIDLMFQDLEDLSIDAIEAAERRWAKTGKWFPRASELRELIEGSQDDAAALAWTQAETAAHKAGASKSVIFEDPAIAGAIMAVYGGWVQFCETMHPVYERQGTSYEERRAARLERREPEGRLVQIGGLSVEMIAAKRKEFLVAYRDAVRRGQGRDYLPGLTEITNLETAGSWTRGRPVIEDGREIFRQPVYIQAAQSSREVSARYEWATARLLDTPKTLLMAVPTRPQLPAKPQQKLLAGESLREEPMPEVVAEGISALQRQWRTPGSAPLTDEEIEARKEQLRKQATTIAEDHAREELSEQF